MKGRVAILVGIGILSWACNQQASSGPTPAATAGACVPSSISYGVMIFGSQLKVVDTCAGVKAGAVIAPSSFTTCGPGGLLANLAPPVSTTSDRVYYRDGDTRIRYLNLDGQTFAATTVPGSSQIVSFFSVSPDDSRIAVLVEDATDGINLKLRLYVEDIPGGGHHADIFSTSVPISTGDTQWPMGWHGGNLVMARIRACSSLPDVTTPVEWGVVDPATADRLVTITAICPPDDPGLLSRWPSAGGVACADFQQRFQQLGWGGASNFGLNAVRFSNDTQSGISLSGTHFFYGSQSAQTYCGSDDPFSSGMVVGPAVEALQPPASCIDGYLPAPTVACLFIDDAQLLTPEGVIVSSSPHQPLPLLKFPTPGTCAGRFPGGL